MVDINTCDVPKFDALTWHTFDKKPKYGQYILVWYEYFRYGSYNRKFQTYGLVHYPYVTLINNETGWQKLRVLAWAELPDPFAATKESKKLALSEDNNYGEEDR